MSTTKVLMLVVVTNTMLFDGICAAPYLLLQPQGTPAGLPTNSFPAFLTLYSDNTFTLQPYTNGVNYVLSTESAVGDKSDLPSSNKYVYPYILHTSSLNGQDILDLPSGGELRNSNVTGADQYTFLPTLGDAIELIPFLPIEVNVPNVISSVMTFFNWMINRRPQEQSEPRIYFLLRNHHGYRLYPFHVRPTLSVNRDNHPSYGGLMERLLYPAYNAHAV